MTLKYISWNIAGKFQIFKLKQVQKYLEKFDIVCLTETRTTTQKTVDFPNFKLYQYPDKDCNYEYPSGGTCLLIKKEIKKLIKHVSLLMTDVIQLTLNNGTKMLTTSVLFTKRVGSLKITFQLPGNSVYFFLHI